MVRRSVLCSKELLKDRSWLVTGGQASIAQRVSKVENTTGRNEETVVLAVDGAPDLPRQRWQCGPPCVDPAGARERRPRSGHGVSFLAGVRHHDMGAPARYILAGVRQIASARMISVSEIASNRIVGSPCTPMPSLASITTSFTIIWLHEMVSYKLVSHTNWCQVPQSHINELFI
jgi:hypothetical protein